MTIKVSISETVTAEQRIDPAFIKLHKESEAFLNSTAFTARYRRKLSLHEGAHAYYARRANAINIKYRGPMMTWHAKLDCPFIVRASVDYTLPVTVTPIEAIKVCIAGFVLPEYYGTPNEPISIEGDMDRAKRWFAELVGGTKEEFETEFLNAKAEILAEILIPSVQEGIVAEMTRFLSEVFPVPTPPRAKLTSAVLRAKRMGWAA